MRWLDNIPWEVLVVGALALGLAPFMPEPHLVEKIRMLFQGTLSRPIDIFDLVMHGAFPLVLLLKIGRTTQLRFNKPPQDNS
ncbi:RND transporter [Candidatus Parabeggiatoa sp. HSG14]|uniref:RND transporter n=1 Tax=Candidatus Parabeggiatoa sp. HSG14 TaxID=3055593 RepID=UPI0025A90C6F|nr:RND transporter [Thiotrichales bacterium HSG14]